MQRLTSCLMFVGDQHGKAEEAMNLYVSLFENSRVLEIERYGVDEEEREGTVKRATFSLAGQEFIAMDSGRQHPFTFTPAISISSTATGSESSTRCIRGSRMAEWC